MGVLGKLFKKKPKGTPSGKEEAELAVTKPEEPVATEAAPEGAAPTAEKEPLVNSKDAAPAATEAATKTEEVIVTEVAPAPAEKEPVATGAAEAPEAADADSSVEVVKGASAIVAAPEASAVVEVTTKTPAPATLEKAPEAAAVAPAPAAPQAAVGNKPTKVITLKLKAGWNIKGVKVELRAVGARRPSVFENIGGALRKSVTDLGQLFSPRSGDDEKSRAASPQRLAKDAPSAPLPDEQLLRAFASRVQAAWEQGDIDLFGELCAPDVVFTVPSADVSASGVQQTWAARQKAEPNGLLSFSSIMASASRTSGVVVRRDAATHSLTASASPRAVGLPPLHYARGTGGLRGLRVVTGGYGWLRVVTGSPRGYGLTVACCLRTGLPGDRP